MSGTENDRLVLEISDGSRPPAELPRAGRLLIGSSSERADFVIDRPGVASVHCAIGRTKGGGWALKDMGSPEGTRVNGAPVDSARLSAGDRITIGSCELKVVDPRAALSTPTAAPAPAALAPATPVSNPSPTLTTTATRSAPLPTITGYTVERILGRGGMGDVYLALQARLDRRVALKVLAKKLEADVEFVRRFQAEARAAAALNHPNVVTVYDVGEDRGTHYLSMEYMDRGNLEQRLAERGKLPWREVLDILRDAASGLVYAEARGIVHRDLKPANLMQNHVGATKIADLGLATHVESEEATAVDKKIFGTPHFMSPEQARGEKVDSRSDLYSLGATAYRLLSGHTAFEGTNAREILRAHQRDTPRPLRSLAPDVPEDLERLVARLMQKEPAQRFASAAELVREFDRIRAQTGSVPASVAPPRKRGGWATVAALVILAIGAWWMFGRTSQTTPVESAPNPLTARGPESASDPVASSEPTSTDPAPGENAPAQDEESALQLFEANARVALLEVASREMTPEALRDELRALAVKFRGTTAAAEAADRAEALASEIVENTVKHEQRQAAIEEISTRLRAAADLERRPPNPSASFAALAAVAGQQALEGDSDFTSAKRSIEHAIVQAAAGYAKSEMAKAQAAHERGAFDEAESTLVALLPVFDLPDFPMGHGPPGLDDLFELSRRTRERLKNLEFARANHQSERAREDSLTVARAQGGPAGLEHELATLDFQGARQRLSSIAPSLGSPEAQTFVKNLLADIERGEAALAMLGREFSAGGWRRRSFNDPRERRAATRNAVGADSGGILYEGEGGAVERLPWSAFGGSTKELSKLFFERCTRAYTADEESAISGLVRITAVVEALRVVGKMLDPARRSNFTDVNARELSECFAAAREWAKSGPPADALARERGAAEIFGEALVKSTSGAYSAAVAGVERLLRDHEDTLFVRLLSDGAPALADTGSSSATEEKSAPAGDPPR
jgi:serine/threonine protein kinase